MRVSVPGSSLLVCLLAAAGLSLGAGSCGTPTFRFLSPVASQLSLAGPISVSLNLPSTAVPGTLSVKLDGADVTGLFTGGAATRPTATLPSVSEGVHVLVATVSANVAFVGGQVPLSTQTAFETVALESPDQCEVLNNGDCLLPYPSSRFLTPAATPTGYRLNFPSGFFEQSGTPLDPAPYNKLDGFSPTVQVLMHFPGGGVDPALSNAAHIRPETRTYDSRSLDADSPSILIDADTGEHILHFLERDGRILLPTDSDFVEYGDLHPLFLRPGKSLTPGHRYIVAVRNLVHPDGSPVVAEKTFAALRDKRPTDIPTLVARQAHFEDVFARLGTAGVGRNDLVLAFDWVTASDVELTGQMLSMRDQAFNWLASKNGSLADKTFTVNPAKTVERDCTQPGVTVWREIEGTYQVPLFLTSDPVTAANSFGTLRVDANGDPVWSGYTNAPFTVALPCTVIDPSLPAPYPLYLGHGLFGDGRGFVKQIAGAFPELNASAGGATTNVIAGGTDWRGLSSPDIPGFVLGIITDFNVFPALPDRLRQGQLNALVLARMMKVGVFNLDPAFQKPGGGGVFTPNRETFYLGGSLGGIMGLMFAALSPDVNHVAAVVPSINFSILLERATPYLLFEAILGPTIGPSRIRQALVLQIAHELWVRGESAGYATHITSHPLPGTNAKQVLISEAWLDHQVSNVGTEIAARTLGLANLVGSRTPGKAGIPDVPGPLASAYVSYDTGFADPLDPVDMPFVPPNFNKQVEKDKCDPHGRAPLIPASVRQLVQFLQPGGTIENFCNGLCDADSTLLPDGLLLETPEGKPACNPLPKP